MAVDVWWNYHQILIRAHTITSFLLLLLLLACHVFVNLRLVNFWVMNEIQRHCGKSTAT